jgi:hypothetical protein
MSNHFLFSCCFKNKPYQLREEYAFVLEIGAVTNNILHQNSVCVIGNSESTVSEFQGYRGKT